MKNGRMYVFRYVTASDEYASSRGRVKWTPPRRPKRPLTDRDRCRCRRRPPRSGILLGVAGQRLPDGIQFFLGETQTDARLGADRGRTRRPRRRTTRCRRSCSIPTARRRTRALVLTNERFFVEITLRGLTGMVRVSELLSSEELSARGGVTQ